MLQRLNNSTIPVEPNNKIEVQNRPNSISADDLYKSPVIEDIERENKEMHQAVV